MQSLSKPFTPAEANLIFIVFRHITILAPGLLGTSVALAAQERGLAKTISVWARRPEARVELKKQPWCDQVFSTPEEACHQADLVIICTPVGKIVPLVRQIRGSVQPETIVTDVGSVKSQISREGHDLMPKGPFFIGSHPMAGSEKTGMEHARADLFTDRPCFVTPLPTSNPDIVEKVVRFWTELGSRVTTATPEDHDEIVAHISHLPHVLAAMLCSFLQRKNPQWRNFSGNGLRDTTRIAAGSPTLWREILEQNHDEVLRAIRAFQSDLEAFQADLANRDFSGIEYNLLRGKEYRDGISPN